MLVLVEDVVVLAEEEAEGAEVDEELEVDEEAELEEEGRTPAFASRSVTTLERGADR